MVDSEQNQPPEHEAQPEPAGNDPTVVQLGQADDQPKIQAVEQEPKTPELAQRAEFGRDLTVIAATVGALATLLGAAVGAVATGYFSDKAAQRQADAQIRTAQSSNMAQAEAALMAKRQTDYANFLTAETDLQGIEMTLKNYFLRFPLSESDRAQFLDRIGQWNDLMPKAVHADFIVGLIDSPDVDKARVPISAQQNEIENYIHTFAQSDRNNQPIDSSTLQDYVSKVDGLQPLFETFAGVARTSDMKLPPPGS
jgi:hypothetical protein